MRSVLEFFRTNFPRRLEWLLYFNSFTRAPLKNQRVAKLTAFRAVLWVFLPANSEEIKHSQTVYLDKDIYLITTKWITSKGGIVMHARENRITEYLALVETIETKQHKLIE